MQDEGVGGRGSSVCCSSSTAVEAAGRGAFVRLFFGGIALSFCFTCYSCVIDCSDSNEVSLPCPAFYTPSKTACAVSDLSGTQCAVAHRAETRRNSTQRNGHHTP